jgi:hypothetical protein
MRLAGTSIEITLANAEAPPSEVEALVFEEDTFLVLSAGDVVVEPEEPRARVLANAYASQATAPGSVLVQSGKPLRLLAVVHDLSRTPSCQEEWVAAALAAGLRESEAHGLRTLALPLLGRVHGELELERFLTLLHDALAQVQPRSLERLWLLAAPADLESASRLLERWL